MLVDCEIHLTFAPEVSGDTMSTVARDLAGKVHTIELLGGCPRQALQPMITVRRSFDSQAALSDGVEKLYRHTDLQTAPITRCKVETAPTTTFKVLYYESHLLLRGPASLFDATFSALAPTFAAFEAHVSRSHRITTTGDRERYLTRRDRFDYQTMMQRHLDWIEKMKTLLTAYPEFTVAKLHHEAVVFDSNESLDGGWS
jgi:hypothetical protein